jgi:Arc/MetJ-type ribon-helix-helix transcriptional regulator
MPSIKGKPKEQISYKCPHDILQKIAAVIESGEYASRNDVITAAMILFFNDRNTGCKEQVIEWLKSEEGKEWIQMQIRTVLDEMGSETEKTG